MTNTFNKEDHSERTSYNSTIINSTVTFDLEESSELITLKGESEHELKLEMPLKMERIIITIAFVLVVIIALSVHDIKIVFGLIGATVSNMIAFMLPGAFFIKACKMNLKDSRKIKQLKFLTWVSWFLITFGIVVMIICIFAVLS